MNFIDKLLLIGNPQELGYAGIFELLIQMHITFGVITLVTGTLILGLRKGTLNHKKIGKVFVIAMLGNFLLGVPLGTAGQLLVGEPADIMTAVGAMFVGTLAYSGYRWAQAGATPIVWYDKAMWGVQVLTAGLYFYVALLMVAGTSLLGLTALTMAGDQATIFDNSFDLLKEDAYLVGTTSGTVFAYIISETFVTPLFLSVLLIWFSYKDWERFQGTKKIARAERIQQHLTRLLVTYGATITAVMLNANWTSFWVDWTLPAVVALGVSAYYFIYGYQRKTLSRIRPQVSVWWTKVVG